MIKKSQLEKVTLVGGQTLWAHIKDNCIGNFCCIHRPSDHHMKDWPQNWRGDIGIMERICPHGIGHPDPNDLSAYMVDGDKYGIHGCDGCCAPPKIKKNIQNEEKKIKE